MVFGIIGIFILSTFTLMVIGFESNAFKNNNYKFLINYSEHLNYTKTIYSNNKENYQAYDTSCFRDYKNIELENKNGILIDDEVSDSFENDIDKKYQTYVKELDSFGSDVIYVPDDYPSIQSAVENATAGDEIIVRDGNYYENVFVDKPLIIRSENGNANCIIRQGKNSNHVFYAKSDFVTISGFKIVGKEDPNSVGIRIRYFNNTTISYNKFSKTYYFIKGKQTRNNIIHDNQMGSSSCYMENWGIWLQNNSNNQIYNNTISNIDQNAVAIHCELGKNNLIKNNILRGSYCIGLLSSENNTIIDNNMKLPGGFWAQMFIDYSHYNQIINNTYESVDADGIILQYSNNNTFYDNIFKESGIFVYESYDTIVRDNIVRDKPLIYLEKESGKTINEDAGQIIIVRCDNIKILNQKISKTITGIELFKTSNSIIEDSIFIDNCWEGIYAYKSNNNIIQNCNFSTGWHGLVFYKCNENILKYNLFKDISWESAIIYKSHYNTITKNTVTGSFYGIELRGSNYNNISYNELYSLSQYTYNGAIELFNSKYNKIKYNNIHHQHRGIDLMESSDYNLVKRNIFRIKENYVGQKCSLLICESKDNFVYENNFMSGTVSFGWINSSHAAHWRNNYWGKFRILPKIIVGSRKIGQTDFSFPWINIDWRPALRPYDNGM